MRAVVYDKVERRLIIRSDDPVQTLLVGLIGTPESRKCIVQTTGALVFFKVATVCTIGEVYCDMLLGMEDLEPERDTPTVPNAEFEDVLRTKIIEPDKESLVLVDKGLDLEEVEALVRELPRIRHVVLKTKDEVIEHHPIGIPDRALECRAWICRYAWLCQGLGELED
jgi:hypothetical protein